MGIGLFVLLSSGGCTPLGGWLYDDPSFILSELTLPGKGPGNSALALTITTCNRNDFSIQGSDLTVSLVLAGDSVARGQFKDQFTLAMRDSTRLALRMPPVMPLPDSEPQRPSYALSGRAIVYTPLGTRTVQLRQQGRMTRRRDSVLVPERLPVCRPGKSTLPPLPSVPIIIEPPEPRSAGGTMPGQP